jgi:hypothetical protein
MSDKVTDPMLKNLQEVFNERDLAHRISAVKSIMEGDVFPGFSCLTGNPENLRLAPSLTLRYREDLRWHHLCISHDRKGREKMRDKATDLMLKNLQEVFNERDAARRINAVKSIYTKNAEFLEGNERIKGHDAISARVAVLQASFPPDFTLSPTSVPAHNHDLGRLTWRVGPAAAPPVATGMDVALFERGRIRALYTFLDDVARP